MMKRRDWKMDRKEMNKILLECQKDPIFKREARDLRIKMCGSPRPKDFFEYVGNVLSENLDKKLKEIEEKEKKIAISRHQI